MSEDKFRDLLKECLRKYLGKWAREIEREFMNNEQIVIKNWPGKIEVELPCECCGEMVKVPFRIKAFRGFDAQWPCYMEYQSPKLHCSTCPKCKMPFRMNRPVPARLQ